MKWPFVSRKKLALANHTISELIKIIQEEAKGQVIQCKNTTLKNNTYNEPVYVIGSVPIITGCYFIGKANKPLLTVVPVNTGEETMAGCVRQSQEEIGTVRTLRNCALIKNMVQKGIGEPEQRNGRCLGYAGNTDEPCETCKECNLQESNENGDAK